MWEHTHRPVWLRSRPPSFQRNENAGYHAPAPATFTWETRQARAASLTECFRARPARKHARKGNGKERLGSVSGQPLFGS